MPLWLTTILHSVRASFHVCFEHVSVYIACVRDCCLQKPFEIKRQVNQPCLLHRQHMTFICNCVNIASNFPSAILYWLATNPPFFLYMIIRNIYAACTFLPCFDAFSPREIIMRDRWYDSGQSDCFVSLWWQIPSIDQRIWIIFTMT